MENKTCKICNSNLEVERRCKFCEEPTRMFCHTCGMTTEKSMHPACMILDVSTMLQQVQTHRK